MTTSTRPASLFDSADRVLSAAAWIAAFLVLTAICVAPWDGRSLDGVNPWFKPIKYSAAVTVYLATMALLIRDLPGPPWAVALIRWGVAFSMTGVSLLIGLQALRGVASHFNANTAFDTYVSVAIVLLSVINTLLVFLAFFHFLWQEIELPRAYLMGIRMGLSLFVFGSLIGGTLMLIGQSHMAGAVDLRWAHLAGMSAIVSLPLAGHAVSRWFENRAATSQLFLVTGAGSCWILLFALALR